MYTNTNFASKKALKDAVKAGEEVRIHSPGPFPCATEGWEVVEGPHYPQPHKWAADVFLENGKVTKVK